MEFEVVIKASNNHQFIVIAGCGIFNYNNVDDLLKDVKEILTNHKEVVSAVHRVAKP